MTDDELWRRPERESERTTERVPTVPSAREFAAVPDADFDEAEPTVVVTPVGASHRSGSQLPDDVIAEPQDPTPVAGIPLVQRRSRRRRWLRRSLLGAAIVVGVVTLYYLVTLYQVWSTGRNDQARAVDAIVVMGAAQYDGRPSPLLQARLDHAILLFEAKHASVIVVTGGKQAGDRFTEAAASKKYLTQHGVPAAAILSESKGHTTWESLDGVSSLLRKRTDRPTVLIVTDPFHSLRSRLVAQELGLRAYVSATRTSPWGGSTQFRKSLKEAAGIAVGRIIGFRRLWSVTG